MGVSPPSGPDRWSGPRRSGQGVVRPVHGSGPVARFPHRVRVCRVGMTALCGLWSAEPPDARLRHPGHRIRAASLCSAASGDASTSHLDLRSLLEAERGQRGRRGPRWRCGRDSRRGRSGRSTVPGGHGVIGRLDTTCTGRVEEHDRQRDRGVGHRERAGHVLVEREDHPGVTRQRRVGARASAPGRGATSVRARSMQGVRTFPSGERIVTRTCSNISNGAGARDAPWIDAADAVVEVGVIASVDGWRAELHPTTSRARRSRSSGRSRCRGRATTLRRRCRRG